MPFMSRDWQRKEIWQTGKPSLPGREGGGSLEKTNHFRKGALPFDEVIRRSPGEGRQKVRLYAKRAGTTASWVQKIYSGNY